LKTHFAGDFVDHGDSLCFAVTAGNMDVAIGLLAVGAIGGFITALVTIFVPKISPITAPIYAALEGLVLGPSRFWLILIPWNRRPGAGVDGRNSGGDVVYLRTGIIRATEKVKSASSPLLGHFHGLLGEYGHVVFVRRGTAVYP